MLHKFAYEITRTVHEIVQLDQATTKVADADTCVQIQQNVAECSSALYNVMRTKAAEYTPEDLPEAHKMTRLVSKLAETLHQPAVEQAHLHKLAATVMLDCALQETYKTAQAGSPGQEKTAEMMSYGREFFVQLLSEVI